MPEFKVEQHSSGRFKISLGDGKRGGYMANSAYEIAIAVRHYFRPGNEVHLTGSGTVNEDCPLCRDRQY